MNLQGAWRRFGPSLMDSLQRDAGTVLLLTDLHSWPLPAPLLARCSELVIRRSFPGGAVLLQGALPTDSSTALAACSLLRNHGSIHQREEEADLSHE